LTETLSKELIFASADAVPPAPVQVIPNPTEPVAPTETAWLPEAATAPLHPPAALQPEAPVEDQVNVTVSPFIALVADAEMTTVGAGGGAEEPPPQADRRIIEKIAVMRRGIAILILMDSVVPNFEESD